MYNGNSLSALSIKLNKNVAIIMKLYYTNYFVFFIPKTDFYSGAQTRWSICKGFHSSLDLGTNGTCIHTKHTGVHYSTRCFTE